eukprot:CAMPEP_0113302944 /NCGR_PEP_ID=MMETSP0010_2-20120614/3563_1 /TAXON_ID=216773 ORGANISM="Corethron hystrix, Strain 308" /NCGR_SAMPLE_ID=MMETSP0010_2 /ASSEMBLY_ACC=CAM_ASM_000155 /LENGTH=186 /DNA_ID=CAMNT_0000156853 /DNA_START=23 /DNA_END=583 /DNA_ORIENTATION=- /assembly_acc=CAM_ASM_000155
MPLSLPPQKYHDGVDYSISSSFQQQQDQMPAVMPVVPHFSAEYLPPPTSRPRKIFCEADNSPPNTMHGDVCVAAALPGNQAHNMQRQACGSGNFGLPYDARSLEVHLHVLDEDNRHWTGERGTTAKERLNFNQPSPIQDDSGVEGGMTYEIERGGTMAMALGLQHYNTPPQEEIDPTKSMLEKAFF